MAGRYERLLSLSSFSKEDLKVLQSKKVLIVGVGGVGQHIATYLITNGIENLTIVDYDVVEMSNLNRQILLTENDTGEQKIEVVRKALLKRNSDAQIKSINQKITLSNAANIIEKGYDVVVDALDNWESKFVVSDECYHNQIPLLHVGVDGMTGQWCILVNKSLRDILPIDIIKEKRDGVMGSVVGGISSLASSYLIEFLIGKKESNILLSFNFKENNITKIKI